MGGSRTSPTSPTSSTAFSGTSVVIFVCVVIYTTDMPPKKISPVRKRPKTISAQKAMEHPRSGYGVVKGRRAAVARKMIRLRDERDDITTQIANIMALPLGQRRRRGSELGRLNSNKKHIQDEIDALSKGLIRWDELYQAFGGDDFEPPPPPDFGGGGPEPEGGAPAQMIHAWIE